MSVACGVCLLCVVYVCCVWCVSVVWSVCLLCVVYVCCVWCMSVVCGVRMAVCDEWDECIDSCY